MDVKHGYKQTEVGIIPKDWEIKRLNQLGSTYGGLTGKTKMDFGRGTSHYITFMNIMGNVKIDCRIFELVDIKQKEKQNRVIRGDLFFNGSSETPEEVGMCAVLMQDVKNVFLNSFCFGFRLREETPVDGLYLAYYFRSQEGRELLKSLAQGATRYNLSKTAFLKISIPLPSSKAEQEAIAEALSDADALIESIEELIAKKRDIKQGTMQELLTGKRRLPGYYEEWKTVRLQSLLSYERPDQYIVRDTQYSEYGNTPVLTANKSFILGYTDESFGICKDVPVIVFDDFTTDSKYVDFPFKVKSSAIKLLRPKHNQINLRFIFQRMRLIQFPLGDHKRYYISEYQNLELAVPDYAEQTAIATVLSDMDAELNALEAKLRKAHQIKQGMMQELFTGRIRLI